MTIVEKQPFLILLGVFCCSVGLLIGIYLRFPKLQPEEKQHFKVPKNMEDAKQLGLVLSKYKEDHYFMVLTGVFVVYIFLQSFAIPGSIFLSIMSGYLFPFPLALILVCTCSAAGAAICYLLSLLVGKRLVQTYWPDRIQQWCMQVQKHREHLFNYMIFLRITPFLPNWFINLASPVIDVPLSTFFWGTFFGVAPPSCFFIHAGTTLNKLTKSSEAFSWMSVIILGLLAFLAILPVIFKQRLRRKLE